MRIAQPQAVGSYCGREGPDWPRSIRWWSVTHWIIAINIAFYAVDLISDGRLTEWGAFTADAAVYRLQLWRWVSYAFLHGGVWHLLFNVFVLWINGPVVEARLGRARYLAFYLLSGLGAVAGYLLLWRLNSLAVTRYTMLIGSSGCIFGVMVAAAHIVPHRVYHFWGVVALTLRQIMWICIGVAIVQIAARGPNAGGEAAHLGGAAVGAVLIRNVTLFHYLRIGPRKHRFWRPGDPAGNFFRGDAG
jgi:membrane associated rhomboid family serine protease